MSVQLVACLGTLNCPMPVRVNCRQQGGGSHGLVEPTRVTYGSSFDGVGISKLGFRLSDRVKSGGYPRYTAFAVSVKEFLLASQPNFYDLLGISQDVSFLDIKQAYRAMARKYHPDVCLADQSEDPTRKFIEMQEAYETLSDPRRRAIYDHTIAKGFGSGTSIRKSWDFGPWDLDDKDSQQNHWRCQWQDQLNGLKIKSSMKVHKAESWAASVRRQKSRCQ